MTRWPTVFESSVWATPSAPVATAIAIIPTTSATSRPVFASGIACVEHRAEQERRDHPERRREQDQAEDRAEAPVGRAERGGAAAAIQPVDVDSGGSAPASPGRPAVAGVRR